MLKAPVLPLVASLVVGLAVAAHAQAPAALPALTPVQMKVSAEMAKKYDRSAALEQERLAAYKGRPLAAVIQRTFNIGANYLQLAAQMMPESAYNFRPTMDVRTFAEQMNHATVSRYSFCNQAGAPPGFTLQRSPRMADVKTKAQIVKALEDSATYCNSVIKASTEAWLMEEVPEIGGATSGKVFGMRAFAFMYNNVHDTEDYGTITTYLRMNGLVPPSSALHIE